MKENNFAVVAKQVVCSFKFTRAMEKELTDLLRKELEDQYNSEKKNQLIECLLTEVSRKDYVIVFGNEYNNYVVTYTVGSIGVSPWSIFKKVGNFFSETYIHYTSFEKAVNFILNEKE